MPSRKAADRDAFGSLLSRAARQWRRSADLRLQPFDLTEATWLPLVHIARAPAPPRQKDLAASMSLDGSSVARRSPAGSGATPCPACPTGTSKRPSGSWSMSAARSTPPPRSRRERAALAAHADHLQRHAGHAYLRAGPARSRARPGRQRRRHADDGQRLHHGSRGRPARLRAALRSLRTPAGADGGAHALCAGRPRRGVRTGRPQPDRRPAPPGARRLRRAGDRPRHRARYGAAAGSGAPPRDDEPDGSAGGCCPKARRPLQRPDSRASPATTAACSFRPPSWALRSAAAAPRPLCTPSSAPRPSSSPIN